MIIFYNKQTGDIYGMIEGRIHTEEEISTASISIAGVDDRDIGKYVVTFEPVYSGSGKTKVFTGMVASEFADEIEQFERDNSTLYAKRVELGIDGRVLSFEDKASPRKAT